MHALMAIAAFIATCVCLVVLGAVFLVVIPAALLCWGIAWLFGDREEDSGGEN